MNNTKITFYCIANEHPVVVKTLEKQTENTFGWINDLFDTKVSIESDNISITEFATMKLNTSELTASQLIEIINIAITKMIEVFKFKHLSYKIEHL